MFFTRDSLDHLLVLLERELMKHPAINGVEIAPVWLTQLHAQAKRMHTKLAGGCTTGKRYTTGIKKLYREVVQCTRFWTDSNNVRHAEYVLTGEVFTSIAVMPDALAGTTIYALLAPTPDDRTPHRTQQRSRRSRLFRKAVLVGLTLYRYRGMFGRHAEASATRFIAMAVAHLSTNPTQLATHAVYLLKKQLIDEV